MIIKGFKGKEESRTQAFEVWRQGAAGEEEVSSEHSRKRGAPRIEACAVP